jgi:hypothetical protein
MGIGNDGRSMWEKVVMAKASDEVDRSMQEKVAMAKVGNKVGRSKWDTWTCNNGRSKQRWQKQAGASRREQAVMVEVSGSRQVGANGDGGSRRE